MHNNIVSINFRPGPKDIRDWVYKQNEVELPEQLDLRVYASPVDNQSALGSCAANALVNAYELMVRQQFIEKFKDLSRLYVYYHSRYKENTLELDYGVLYMKSVLDAVKKYGVCTEKLWPYDISKFTIQPNPDCYADAAKRKILEYNSIPNVNLIFYSLVEIKPVVFGMTIFDSFMDMDKFYSTVEIPRENELSIGNHAMCIVGYNKISKTYIVKNSFGVGWGDEGYCYIPFEYLDRYGFDYYNFKLDDQS
jgi:C1A family cysteine protease